MRFPSPLWLFLLGELGSKEASLMGLGVSVRESIWLSLRGDLQVTYGTMPFNYAHTLLLIKPGSSVPSDGGESR